MTEDISDKFRELKENFQLVAKRILKSELTQNRDKHREYIRDLITGYNNIASLVESHANSFDEDSKKYFIGEWRYIRDKIRKAFTRLGIETTLPSGILAHICVNEILSIYNSNCFRNQAYEEFFGAFENFSPEIVYRDRTRKSKRVIMGEDEDKKKAKKEFVRTASQQINYTYSGDPLKLDSFVNSINLLRELTEKEHEMTLVTFVISRLEGKALQCVPAGCNNIDKLIEALKKRLKPIHSKVIMGKLMALRPDRSRLTDFAAFEAEKLAESLERSLVFEGIPQHKSHEMTIQKSLEIMIRLAKCCRITLSNPKRITTTDRCLRTRQVEIRIQGTITTAVSVTMVTITLVAVMAVITIVTTAHTAMAIAISIAIREMIIMGKPIPITTVTIPIRIQVVQTARIETSTILTTIQTVM